MKREISLALAVLMLMTGSLACAQEAQASLQSDEAQAEAPVTPADERPEPPAGEMGSVPPEGPEGELAAPPEKPDGGAPGGAPGGMQSAPEEYAAVYTVQQDTSITGEVQSTGTDENAIHVQAGAADVSDAVITRASDDSTGSDAASFYGVGAAVLATGGTVTVSNSTIETDAAGGAGVFAYADGVAYVSDTTITTRQNASGGIHVAGGGTLYARNLTVTTEGESSAAIRSDRGSGVMVVDGGVYTSNGEGSPAVYVTADVSIHDAELNATGSEALCMEGLNTVRLYDCDLSGDMEDLPKNDNTWTVIVYQSMSGDSQVGEGRFEMSGGTLQSGNGGLFYTTNTESEFVLSGVEIAAAEDSEYFLRATGNANERGWGASGSNGAMCTFTGIGQQMTGDVQWDSISTLDLYVTQGSTLTGAVVDDESCAGEGGEGYCNLYIDEDSSWVVTGDSTVTSLYCMGSVVDADGQTVSVVSPEGVVFVKGDSVYTITAGSYSDTCDLSGAGILSAWEDYAVEF